MNATHLLRALTRRNRIRGRHDSGRGHRAPAVLGRKPGCVCSRRVAR